MWNPKIYMNNCASYLVDSSDAWKMDIRPNRVPDFQLQHYIIINRPPVLTGLVKGGNE